MTIGLFTQEFLDQSQLWLDIKNSVRKIHDLYAEPRKITFRKEGVFVLLYCKYEDNCSERC